MNELLARQFVGKSAGLLSYMDDSSITDILINGPKELYIEKDGTLFKEVSPFQDATSLADFIERLLIPIGKRVDAAQPYLDGRCVDGSRFHVILCPIAVGGPFISIRKFRHGSERICLSSFGSEEHMEWLKGQVHERKNVLISGGTGAGKTTLLCRLLDLVPEEERIAVVEESLEILTTHPHVVRLEARPPSPDGNGEVTLRALVKNTLRMRPDRVVLGECRGPEAFDLLQLLNTGHGGSFCTVHASSARDALRRLEALALLAGISLPLKTIREWIASTIHVVVQMERGPTGQRRISEVIKVQGLEGEIYRILPVLSKDSRA